MLGQDYFDPAPKCEESPGFLAYLEGMQDSGAYGTPSTPAIDAAVEIRLVENQARLLVAVIIGEECATAGIGPAFQWVDETALLEGGLALADP